MAFNPFNVFRRNQKILFAMLTVVVMFMFVLSFGQGDFFSSVPRWLGSTRQTGDVLAVVDGAKVTESDISRLSDRRQFANQYMSFAARRASDNLRKSVSDGLTRVSPENRQVIQALIALRQSQYIDPQTLQQLRFQELISGQPASLADYQAAQQRTIAQLYEAVGQILNSKSPKEADLEVARAARSLINLDQTVMATTQNHYFNNLPNRGNRDLMEFHLWLLKADQLGIRFSEADINKLVNEEFLNHATTEDWRAAEEGLRTKRGFNADTLKEALANEFRVRAAQSVVLGPSFIQATGSWYDPPFDAYTFYREQTSLARFGLISIPAANFLNEVKGEPTETELRDLLRRAKDLETNPALSRIGLREPRKLKLEWLELTGKEPYYKTAAIDGIQKAGVMARNGEFFIAPLGGSSMATFLAAPAPLFTVTDPVLESKYQQYKHEQEFFAMSNFYSRPRFGTGHGLPQDTAVVNHIHVAATAGTVAGILASAGTPWATTGLLAGLSFNTDQRARLESFAASFVAPVSPVGIPSVVLTSTAKFSAATRPLPLDAVRGQLVEKTEEDFARTIANGDFTKVMEDTNKLAEEGKKAPSSDAAKAKEAEAKAYVEKFIKEKGLKSGRTSEFRDQYSIFDEPAMVPLAERQELQLKLRGRYFPRSAYGEQFFFEQGPGGNPLPSTGLYKPQPFAAGQVTRESAYLVWRIAEEEAYSLRDFNAPGAREKTLAAWKKLKARELARQAAEQLAKECQNLGTNFFEIEQNLRDKRAALASRFTTQEEKDRIRYFEIDRVAPIVTETGVGFGQEQVRPFRLGRMEEIPYPTQKMEEDILATKEKPISSAVVLTDNPEDRYYVAVLVRRDERSFDEFGLTMYGPSFGPFRGPLPSAVNQRRQVELHKKNYETALALLKSEFRYEKENEAKLKEKTDSTEE